MRIRTTIFRCDRCGEELSIGYQSELNDAGWRRTIIGAYSGDLDLLIGKIPRDFCRTCYVGLVAYIEMSGDDLLDIVSQSNEN